MEVRGRVSQRRVGTRDGKEVAETLMCSGGRGKGSDEGVRRN